MKLLTEIHAKNIITKIKESILKTKLLTGGNMKKVSTKEVRKSKKYGNECNLIKLKV